MDDEGMITMTQLKVIVEDFKSGLKRVAEVMQHGFAKLEAKANSHSEQIGLLLEGQTAHSKQIALLQDGQTAHSKQIALVQDGQAEHSKRFDLLDEGQAEIINLLKSKVDHEELNRLETRVTKLENKVA
jgi:hypothetical protein